MRKRSVRLLLAGCGTVLTAALAATAAPAGTQAASTAPAGMAGASTALVAATWTITPGGAFTAKSGRAPIRDTKVGKLMTCTSLTASGTLKSGSGVPGPGAGSVSAFGFHTCTDPLASGPTPLRRLVFEMTATGLPWHLNLTSYGNGVVAGTISHMQIQMVGTQCTAVIDGTGAAARDGHVRFRYSDTTGHLTVLTNRSGLHFFDVRGCFGLIHDGDPATISATFVVSPEQAITSP